jgi:chromosome segregation ATPase
MGDREDQLDISSAIVARQVASGLSATTRLIQSLAADVRENSLAVASIKTEVASLKDDVRIVSEILLREEKGTKPVLTRLALLEQLSEDMGKDVDKLESSSENIKTKVMTLTNTLSNQNLVNADQREVKKYRIQLLVAVITSIGALVAAILTAIFS